MKILVRIILIMRRIGMTVICRFCLNFVDGSSRLFGVGLEQVALEEELKTNKTLAMEVHVVEDRAVIEGVSMFITSCTQATVIKGLFVADALM